MAVLAKSSTIWWSFERRSPLLRPGLHVCLSLTQKMKRKGSICANLCYKYRTMNIIMDLVRRKYLRRDNDPNHIPADMHPRSNKLIDAKFLALNCHTAQTLPHTQERCHRLVHNDLRNIFGSKFPYKRLVTCELNGSPPQTRVASRPNRFNTKLESCG